MKLRQNNTFKGAKYTEKCSIYFVIILTPKLLVKFTNNYKGTARNALTMTFLSRKPEMLLVKHALIVFILLRFKGNLF